MSDYELSEPDRQDKVNTAHRIDSSPTNGDTVTVLSQMHGWVKARYNGDVWLAQEPWLCDLRIGDQFVVRPEWWRW